VDRTKKLLIFVFCSLVACLAVLLPAGATGDGEGSLSATVTVVPSAKDALTTLTPQLASDGAAGCMASIVQGQDAQGNSVVADIKSYTAALSYNGNLINVLEVRHQSMFPGAGTIDNPSGSAEFNGTAPEGVATPCDVAFLTLRLTGAVGQPATVRLTFSNIYDSNGNLIHQLTPAPERQFLRGDATGDGEVNIRDVIYIVQYLAGLRDAGEGLGKVNPVNAASVKHDGKYDAISFSDAWYLLQYLARGRRLGMEWRRGVFP
jgi:hypothetical protein